MVKPPLVDDRPVKKIGKKIAGRKGGLKSAKAGEGRGWSHR
jgi:hypothetical protein